MHLLEDAENSQAYVVHLVKEKKETSQIFNQKIPLVYVTSMLEENEGHHAAFTLKKYGSCPKYLEKVKSVLFPDSPTSTYLFTRETCSYRHEFTGKPLNSSTMRYRCQPYFNLNAS